MPEYIRIVLSRKYENLDVSCIYWNHQFSINGKAMAIDYSITPKGSLLVVKAGGRDESLEEVAAYGAAVIEACKEHGCDKIICDERELEYDLNLLETLNLGSFYSEVTPTAVRVAIVCSPDSYDEARFFEDVSVNRGLTLHIFLDYDRAMKWLTEDE